MDAIGRSHILCGAWTPFGASHTFGDTWTPYRTIMLSSAKPDAKRQSARPKLKKKLKRRSPRLPNHREGTIFWAIPLHGRHMGGHPFWVNHGRHAGGHTIWVTHGLHRRVCTCLVTHGRHTELSCFPKPRQTQNSKTVYQSDKVFQQEFS